MGKFSFALTIMCGVVLPGAVIAQGYGYNYGQQQQIAQQPGYASPSYYYGAPQQQPQAYPQPSQPAGYGQPAGYAPQPQQRSAQAVSAGTLGATGYNIAFPSESGDDVDVLRLQIYLDYHGYSPGEIDGKWGYNTERALFVYQKINGMSATGQLDSRIVSLLDGFKDGYLLEYTLKEEDVNQRIGTIPRTYPEQSRLKWLPYESRAEAIAEKFHLSQGLLKKLNPGVDFERVSAGTKLLVLNVVNGADTKRARVALIRISASNKWLMAYDADGKLLHYYPCTIGRQDKDPLAVGKTYEVTAAVKNPPFKYKPENMWDDELGREYDIPPGPNSPVGNVWIGTTRRSVGIHGTPNPENISKNHSHGCIRLTNWDANQLSSRVTGGVKIEFVE